MRIVSLTKEAKDNILEDLLKRSPNNYDQYQETVNEILNEVKTKGDEAVFAYTEKFDHAKLTADTLYVTEDEIKEAYEKAVFLLKQVKIPSPEVRIQQYPHELSGGMQQRVMIAIALACNPKVLIADEPTTALDVTIQAQILSLLKELRDQLGIAVILITHNMGVVAAVCDRMLVMYGGAVVEEGKCTELFENPCHPYTRGLLAAIPSIKERKEKLYTIPGQVPKMKVPVQYCRFCSRCSYAQEVCHEKEPGMQGENGHLYKCFYTPQQQEKEKCGPGGGAL